jgi:hypothetical protein
MDGLRSSGLIGGQPNRVGLAGIGKEFSYPRRSEAGNIHPDTVQDRAVISWSSRCRNLLSRPFPALGRIRPFRPRPRDLGKRECHAAPSMTGLVLSR